MDQEANEDKTLTSRNNTQNIVVKEKTFVMKRNNTQQTDQGKNEKKEDNQKETLKKRKRNTKKKDQDKPKRRALATKSKERSASPTVSSNTEFSKEINSKTLTPEEKVKHKNSSNGRNLWSLEEDKRLADKVLANLQDVPWSKIAREDFSNRGRSGCYNRWNVIKKRLYQGINSYGGEK